MSRLFKVFALALSLSCCFAAHADSIQGVVTKYTYYAEGYVVFDPDIGEAYNIIHSVSQNRKCLKTHISNTVYDKTTRA